MDQDDLDEVVLIYKDDATAIASEMRYAEFESLLNRSASIVEFSASVVKAAYVAVGRGLSVRAVVLFLLKIDEHGQIDSQFNLPLRYLAQQAGVSRDCGTTQAVQVAYRGLCSVPWHSVHLWEPGPSAKVHPVMLAQKCIWRNKLGLNLSNGQFGVTLEPEFIELQGYKQELEQRLTEALGKEGRVSLTQIIKQNNAQLEQIKQRYRAEIDQQQQAYLDQLRSARNEIHKLKAALRHEQSRNRRLQELLRGDL